MQNKKKRACTIRYKGSIVPWLKWGDDSGNLTIVYIYI